MIESCSKKQMIIGISCLGGLTLLILIVESYWTNGTNGRHHPLTSLKNATNGDGCWLTEDFEILEECHPCTAFEVASKSVPACVYSGYKEILQCKNSGKVFRSCDKVAWIEERKFWTFEGCMLLAALFFGLVACSRQHILDRQMLQRIQRQLARGV